MSKTKFVVFSQGRTGSTLFMDLLNSHPDIRCDGELLYYPLPLPRTLIDIRSRICRKQLYGFKLKLYQLSEKRLFRIPENYLGHLVHEGWKIISIKRSNILKQLISLYYAKATRLFHRRKKHPENYEPRKITLAPDFIMRQLKNRQKLTDRENALLRDLPVHSVSYERDLLLPGSHQKTLDAVFDYLSVSGVTVKSNLLKNLPYRMDQILKNYDEIYQTIRNSEFKSFLMEGDAEDVLSEYESPVRKQDRCVS